MQKNKKIREPDCKQCIVLKCRQDINFPRETSPPPNTLSLIEGFKLNLAFEMRNNEVLIKIIIKYTSQELLYQGINYTA